MIDKKLKLHDFQISLQGISWTGHDAVTNDE